MVADKITSEDIKLLAAGVLKVELPDYMACRSAMSLVSYTKDTWREDELGPKPNFSCTIDKRKNTITINLVKN